MNVEGEQILARLKAVNAERERRAADLPLQRRVTALKAYQHARFARTYADLSTQAHTAAAVRFFLEELYGPGDFTHRDAQFARIVPALVRLFPREIVSTVAVLAELHALSEQLDTAMGLSDPLVAASVVDDQSYRLAWQAVGRMADREHQIALMLAVGTALDRYTRNPLLRHSLRLMRGPAQAAGLGALQQFLERGFETFRDLRGAAGFLQLVASRERALAAALFAPATDANAAGVTPGQPSLGQVP
jgi:hypothetical protein